MKDINLHDERINCIKKNSKGELMKCIEYNTNKDIIVEFQDEYKGKSHTSWSMFCSGNVKNPYNPTVFGKGMIGDKYKSRIDGKYTNEYRCWQNMLQRCYKSNDLAYKDVTCCKEWLLYENFYEWLHSQENFDKWYNSVRWALDKDILIKNNKVYSPEACCLVPQNINCLFVKKYNNRGNLPIGVSKQDKYFAACCNGKHIGIFKTPEMAFNAYKNNKEESIKKMAQEEYDKGNITKKCYETMMNYEVEITD